MQREVEIRSTCDITTIPDGHIFVDADGYIYRMSCADCNGNRLCISLDNGEHKTEDVKKYSYPFRVFFF